MKHPTPSLTTRFTTVLWRIPCASLAVLWVLHPLATEAADPAPAGWMLVWSDEFDGDRIDPAKWDFQLGNGFYSYDAKQWIGGWGNDELQTYTRDPENAAVSGGMLRIRALKESRDGCGYTSARLRTCKRDGGRLFAKQYGRFEIRAKLPTGKGIWPAIWMLPQDDTYGTWAASGEIDIMEAVGHEPNKVLGTLHYGSRWPANTHQSAEHRFAAGEGIDRFHVYGLIWEPGRMTWLVDGKPYATRDFWWSCSRMDGGKGAAPANETDLNPWPAPFDKPFHLLINLAVGGRLPGDPDASTPFPAELLVDYVRVYEKEGGHGEAPARGDGELPFGKDG